MFTIKTNQIAKIDNDGRKYITHPISGERIYEFIPPLVEIHNKEIEPNLQIISGLFPSIPLKVSA